MQTLYFAKHSRTSSEDKWEGKGVEHGLGIRIINKPIVNRPNRASLSSVLV